MRNKKIVIIFIALAIVLLGVAIFSSVLDKKQQAAGNSDVGISGGLPGEPTVSNQGISGQGGADLAPILQAPDTQYVEVQGRGGVVEVKNIFKNATPSEEGGFTLKETDEYSLHYDDESSIFAILLSSTGDRSKAENEVLDLLAITREEGCRLGLEVYHITGVASLSGCLRR
jgi:hypothetical protein